MFVFSGACKAYISYVRLFSLGAFGAAVIVAGSVSGCFLSCMFGRSNSMCMGLSDTPNHCRTVWVSPFAAVTENSAWYIRYEGFSVEGRGTNVSRKFPSESDTEDPVIV